MITRPALPLLLLAALLPGLLGGCKKNAEQAPPPLPVAPSAGLKSAMWSMVTSTGALTELLGKAAAPTSAELAEARRLLDEVHRAASSLAADPAARAHPILGSGLPGFLAEVEAARAALAKEPPELDGARRLASSCRGCHGVAMRAQPPEQGERRLAVNLLGPPDDPR